LESVTGELFPFNSAGEAGEYPESKRHIVTSPLSALALGCVAALCWGIGDFTGGMATRKTSVFYVVAIAEMVGLLFTVGLAVMTRETFPPVRGVLLGVLAGLLVAIGLAAFYRTLASGLMGIQAPLTALLSALLPVAFGMATQGIPRFTQLLGIVLALGAVILISLPHDATLPARDLLLPAIAGCGFGGFLIMIKQAGEIGVFWILSASHAASLLVMLIIMMFGRGDGAPKSPKALLSQWKLNLTTGIADGIASYVFVMATRTGRLDVSSATASLAAGVDLFLAVVILKERFGRTQKLGMAFCLIAIILLGT
jgi:drug/metabolite transporter (DMT)-like permease